MDSIEELKLQTARRITGAVQTIDICKGQIETLDNEIAVCEIIHEPGNTHYVPIRGLDDDIMIKVKELIKMRILSVSAEAMDFIKKHQNTKE